MNRIRTYLWIALAAISTGGRGQQLVINELMQSNVDCVMDDLNEFPDSWVELYNGSDTVVRLSSYLIGITPQPDEAYRLPVKSVNPGQYVLVYCDKENRSLHTPFRLESGKGCGVYLFRGTECVDSVTGLKKQPAPNIAYGRATDGGSDWGYQAEATPGAANRGGVVAHDQILGDVVFSEQGRVTTGALNLKLQLTMPDGTPEGTEIRYTTNGAEPTSSSTLYTGPITISTTRVVRARPFCKGWLSPRSVVQSYIRFPRDLTLSVVSIATDKKYLDDSKIGIFANNSNEKRNNWRRPVNIEFFTGEEEPSALNQLCETRISGAASRGAAKKSMALYANKRFGTKRFEYEFFPDQKPGLTDFKSLVLRNAGNDFDYLYMRDALIQRTMATHTDLDWQAWRPVIVYINGTYHGILNIRERANGNNVYTNYQGLDDIDLIENWGDLKEGTKNNLYLFRDFYQQKGHTMAEYEEWMDCEEFANLMIMNLYYCNFDFPGNNIIMWRPRAEGGRWRWIAKDADFTMGLYGDPVNYKILEWLYNPTYDWGKNWGANGSAPTQLFRSLMDDPDFRDLFVDRCAIYMGDFLNLEGTRRVWDPMYETIKYEYPHHRKLINEWWPSYQAELTSARNWLSRRTAEFYTQLGKFYDLGTPIPLVVNTRQSSTALGRLTFNGVPLSACRFDGKFYVGHTIILEGEAADGQPVTGWQVRQTSGSNTDIETHEGSRLELTMPLCNGLAIEPLFGPVDGITDVTTDGRHTDEPSPAVYDLWGRKVGHGSAPARLPRGIYIVNGKKVLGI